MCFSRSLPMEQTVPASGLGCLAVQKERGAIAALVPSVGRGPLLTQKPCLASSSPQQGCSPVCESDEMGTEKGICFWQPHLGGDARGRQALLTQLLPPERQLGLQKLRLGEHLSAALSCRARSKVVVGRVHLCNSHRGRIGAALPGGIFTSSFLEGNLPVILNRSSQGNIFHSLSLASAAETFAYSSGISTWAASLSLSLILRCTLKTWGFFTLPCLYFCSLQVLLLLH